MARTLDQIQRQIAKLQAEAQAVRTKEVGGVIARIKEAIGYYGLTPKDLFDGATGKRVQGGKLEVPAKVKSAGRKKAGKVKTRKPVAIKYRDDKGNTWTGRGNKPRWLAAEIAAGRKLEEFLLK